MLTYNMDVAPASSWLRTTPGDAALAQPYYCTEAGLFYGGPHFSTARTSKDSYILFYTLTGAGVVEQGDTAVTLGPGGALLLNCRSPQSYCTAPGQTHWHHYWVHLNGSGVQALEGILNPRHITGVPLSELTAAPQFKTLLAEMKSASTAAAVRQALALHTLLAAMAQAVLTDSAASSNQALVQKAAEYLRENFEKDVTIEQLVEASHLSKAYFLRLFRRYMGTTPYNYLLCQRITRAKELLVTTDLAVGSIAQQVGFYNEANFSTRFAKMASQSPRDYRRSARGAPSGST